jgi:hypothetical protein
MTNFSWIKEGREEFRLTFQFLQTGPKSDELHFRILLQTREKEISLTRD